MPQPANNIYEMYFLKVVAHVLICTVKNLVLLKPSIVVE